MSKYKQTLFAAMSACLASVIYFVGVGVSWIACPWAWHPWLFATVASLWGAGTFFMVLDNAPDGECVGCTRLTKDLDRANNALAVLDLGPRRR